MKRGEPSSELHGWNSLESITRKHLERSDSSSGHEVWGNGDCHNEMVLMRYHRQPRASI